MDDRELARSVKNVRLLAGITPKKKRRPVKTLKKQGQVAAMIGDGANAAPAIKEAHPGAARGKACVAETGEIAGVAPADGKAMIPEAIKEGRVVNDNIRKCVRYLTNTNIGDGMVILTASLLGGPLPLNALQLIWVNIAGDPLVTWLLANGTAAPEVLNRTPRRQNESIFSGSLGRSIINRGLAMGLGAFAVYRESLGSGDSLQITRTKTMAALGIGRFLYLLDCRRENRRPDQELGINKGVKLGGGVILASLAGAMYVPFIRAILNTAPLGLRQWLQVFVWSGLGAMADRGLGYLTKQAKKPPGKSRKAQAFTTAGPAR